MYTNLNPFREAFVSIFREKMFNKKSFLKEPSCIELTLKKIGQSAFVTNWVLTEGSATFFRNQKSTSYNVCKRLQYCEKILVVLTRVLDCLIFSRAEIEKKILKKKVIILSESTEKHIQELVHFLITSLVLFMKFAKHITKIFSKDYP